MRDSVERVCEVCSSAIPKWKAKGTMTCSVRCRFERRKQKVKEANGKRKTPRQANDDDSILFHSCLFGGGGEIDPFVPSRCKCRKLVSEEEAQSLIALGEAVDFETRVPIFTGGAIVQIGKLKCTPRSATVEKAHVERLVGITNRRSIPPISRTKTIEELQAAIQQDLVERAKEEAFRLEFYHDLTIEARRAWIIDVPADVYDAAKRQDWGRPLFTQYKDERTPGGIGVDVVFTAQ